MKHLIYGVSQRTHAALNRIIEILDLEGKIAPLLGRVQTRLATSLWWPLIDKRWLLHLVLLLTTVEHSLHGYFYALATKTTHSL